MRLMLTWPMRILLTILVAISVMRGSGQWVACVETDGRVVIEARHDVEVCLPCDATADGDPTKEECEDLVVPDAKASIAGIGYKQIVEMQCVPAVLAMLPEMRNDFAGARAADLRSDPPRPMVVTTVILLV